MPKSCQKSGKNMGFDTRGSMQGLEQLTCSKQKHPKTGAFVFACDARL